MSLSSPSHYDPPEPFAIANVAERIDQIDDDPADPTSTPKRRKRGTRNKGKGTASSATPIDATLETLAAASQSLAREISKSSRPPSLKTSSSSQQLRSPFEPVSIFPVPTMLCSPSQSSIRPSNGSASSWRSQSTSSKTSLPSTSAISQTAPAVSAPDPAPPLPSPPSVSKKSSKWKLSFGKASGARTYLSGPDTSDMVVIDPRTYGVAMSATASNVSDLIMGLTRPPPSSPSPSSSMNKARPNDDDSRSTSSRGRRSRQRGNSSSRSRSRNSSSQTPLPDHPAFHFDYNPRRALSPSSTQTSSGGSMSSAVTSSSALSSFSSASVSTAATSVSSGSSSWRNRRDLPSDHPVGLPKNVKYITEMPMELTQLPREQRPNATVDNETTGLHLQPRKQRSRKVLKDSKLDTITERPTSAGSPRLPQPRKDASTSTTELDVALDEDGEGLRKRAQGNTFAKMFQALRR